MVRLVLVMVTMAVTLSGAVALADEKKIAAQKVAAAPKLREILEAAAEEALRTALMRLELGEILKLVNAEREKAKLSKLTLDPTLCKVAQDYAELMAQKGKMEHNLDGLKVGARIEAAGYDYRTAAENLGSAVGEKDQPAPKPGELVESWMASKGHKVNIMNEKHAQTGLGVARSKNGDYYYTQIFASKR